MNLKSVDAEICESTSDYWISEADWCEQNNLELHIRWAVKNEPEEEPDLW